MARFDERGARELEPGNSLFERVGDAAFGRFMVAGISILVSSVFLALAGASVYAWVEQGYA